MQKVVMSILAAVLSVSVIADNTAAPRRRGPRRPTGGRPSGGIVEKAYNGKVFRILNLQKEYNGGRLAALTKNIRYATLLPIECEDGVHQTGKTPFEVAESLIATDGVGAGAVIIDDPSLPIELLSPDRRWGILNVASLKADKPSPEKFEQRFTKVYWGIIARTLGAGVSSYPGCVLVPFTDMKGLDAITATRPCPEPFNKMIDTGKAYGIGIITITTYRTACQQGWAQAPTNDVQKAIWNEVHQLPTKPLKIEFDPARGK